MTILFVTHNEGFYGANKSLVALMCLLRDKFGIIPIVLMFRTGKLCDELEKQQIKYYVIHYYWWVRNQKTTVFEYLMSKRKQIKNIFLAKKMAEQLAGEQIDLVYSNSVCTDFGYLLAKRLRVPHIWHLRESLTQFSLHFSLSEWLTKRIFLSQNNKRYILISDYMMKFYRKYLPVDRMLKIYNGINPPDYQRKDIVHPKLQVACVGVVSENKNQLELLQAQALLHNKGVEIETWFVGVENPPSYLRKCQSYACENGIENNVHFLGHKDNVFEFLQDMDLGVVAARDEAFGRTTIEFMMMQMPVVVSRSGANTELMQDGVHGFSYELGNIQALADKIETYAKYRELIVEHGCQAQKHAMIHFSAEQNAEKIYEQIQSVYNQFYNKR